MIKQATARIAPITPSPNPGGFPSNPTNGQQYKGFVWNGTQWVCGGTGGGGAEPGGAQAFVGPNPPAAPQEGELWFNTDTGGLSMWDGSQWQTISAGGSGIPSGLTPPANPGVGQLWFNTGTNQLFVWDGNNWDPIGTPTAVGATPPANPIPGQLLLDGSGTLWAWDGNQWQRVTTPNNNATVSATPPPTPFLGQLWNDTTTQTLKVWDGNAWVVVGTGGTTVGPTAPTNPQPGQLWLNTGNGILWVWDGSGWVESSGSLGNFMGIGGETTVPVAATSTSPYTLVGTLPLPEGDWDIYANLYLGFDTTAGQNFWCVLLPSAYPISTTYNAKPSDSAAWMGFNWGLGSLPFAYGGTIGPIRIVSDGTAGSGVDLRMIIVAGTGSGDVSWTVSARRMG